MRRVMAAVAALALAAPVSAQPATPAVASRLLNDSTLLLAVAERVTVRIAPDGKLSLISVVPAESSDVMRNKPLQPGPGNPLIEAPDGTVAVLLGYANDMTILKVENATSRSIDYQAALLDGASLPVRGVATSVCTVLPHIAGLENWPKRHVPAMLLHRFTLGDAKGVSCPQPSGAPGSSAPPPPASAPP